MSSTLVEILNHLASIESLLIQSKGELSPEDEQALTTFSQSLVEKVDGYKHFFDRLKMSITYWKAKEDESYRIKKTLENYLENAEKHLESIMLSREIKELTGEEYSFKLSPTRGSVEIVDEGAAKEVYGREKVTIEIDKEKVREDLENGIDIKCARIKQNWSLKVKPLNKQITKGK